MKREVKRVLMMISVLILVLSSCKSEEVKIGADDIEAANTEATNIEKMDNKEDFVIPNIVMTAPIDDYKIATSGYEISDLEASFVLENLDAIDYEFTIRIPLYESQLVNKGESDIEPNAVVNNGGKEVLFNIKAGEKKTLELDSVEYELYTTHQCTEGGGFGRLEEVYLLMDGHNYLINLDGILDKSSIDLGNPDSIRDKALLENKVAVLSDKVEALSNENTQFKEVVEGMKDSTDYLTGYSGQKWSNPIGLKQMAEEAEVHIYPNILSPQVDFFSPGLIVTALEYVWAVDWEDEIPSKGEWFMIMTSDGQIGFVMEDGLEDVDPTAYEWIYDYADVTESIAGCTIGNRIEKLIGSLDQDYILGHENSRFYVFQDAAIMDSKAKHSPFTPGGSLDAFPGYTNHISWMRTDSEAFSLDSGISVGSSLKEVLAYYDNLYEPLEITERFGETKNVLAYQIGENAELVFRIDHTIEEAMTQMDNSKVLSIEIRKLGTDNRFG